MQIPSPEGEQEMLCRNRVNVLSRLSKSFWASHSGQTGLASARITFLTRRMSKSSLQCENQYGVRSAIETGFNIVTKQRLAHTQ